jgi:hypothetical protein
MVYILETDKNQTSWISAYALELDPFALEDPSEDIKLVKSVKKIHQIGQMKGEGDELNILPNDLVKYDLRKPRVDELMLYVQSQSEVVLHCNHKAFSHHEPNTSPVHSVSLLNTKTTTASKE